MSPLRQEQAARLILFRKQPKELNFNEISNLIKEYGYIQSFNEGNLRRELNKKFERKKQDNLIVYSLKEKGDLLKKKIIKAIKIIFDEINLKSTLRERINEKLQKEEISNEELVDILEIFDVIQNFYISDSQAVFALLYKMYLINKDKMFPVKEISEKIIEEGYLNKDDNMNYRVSVVLHRTYFKSYFKSEERNGLMNYSLDFEQLDDERIKDIKKFIDLFTSTYTNLENKFLQKEKIIPPIIFQIYSLTEEEVEEEKRYQFILGGTIKTKNGKFTLWDRYDNIIKLEVRLFNIDNNDVKLFNELKIDLKTDQGDLYEALTFRRFLPHNNYFSCTEEFKINPNYSRRPIGKITILKISLPPTINNIKSNRIPNFDGFDYFPIYFCLGSSRMTKVSRVFANTISKMVFISIITGIISFLANYIPESFSLFYIILAALVLLVLFLIYLIPELKKERRIFNSVLNETTLEIEKA